VGAFGKLPWENDLDHKSSRLLIRWLNSTPGESPATILTKTNNKNSCLDWISSKICTLPNGVVAGTEPRFPCSRMRHPPVRKSKREIDPLMWSGKITTRARSGARAQRASRANPSARRRRTPQRDIRNRAWGGGFVAKSSMLRRSTRVIRGTKTKKEKKPVRKPGCGGSALTRLRPIRQAREKKMRHGPQRCSSTKKEICQWQMDRASAHRLGKINNVRNEKSAAGTKSRPRAKDTEENRPNRTQQLDLL
jgi:hypothetical protein